MATATKNDKRDEPALAERLRLEVERAVQRSLKGIELLGQPPPSVGQDAEDGDAPPRHPVALPLPRDRRRGLPGADPVRDGADEQGLHPRPRARARA